MRQPCLPSCPGAVVGESRDVGEALQRREQVLRAVRIESRCAACTCGAGMGKMAGAGLCGCHRLLSDFVLEPTLPCRHSHEPPPFLLDKACVFQAPPVWPHPLSHVDAAGWRVRTEWDIPASGGAGP